jgi:hypothetical protein
VSAAAELYAVEAYLRFTIIANKHCWVSKKISEYLHNRRVVVLIMCQEPVTQFLAGLEMIEHVRDVAKYGLCRALVVGDPDDRLREKPSIKQPGSYKECAGNGSRHWREKHTKWSKKIHFDNWIVSKHDVFAYQMRDVGL